MVPVEPTEPTALTAVAIGIGAATLTEMLLLAMVPDAFVPLNPAVAATKSLPRFDAIAVVSHAGCWNQTVFGPPAAVLCDSCLLYTSDAADERSSVDLGGRRIIKKK